MSDLAEKRKRITQAYEAYGNMEVVSNTLGVSIGDVHYHLHKAGVEIQRPFGTQKSNTTQRVPRNPVGQWILEHPWEKMPQGRHEIAKRVGCKVSHVDRYKSERKKRAGNARKDIPDLRKLPVVLRSDRDGEPMWFLTKDMVEYRVYVHPMAYLVFLHGAMRTGGSVEVVIPLEVLWKRIEEASSGR